MSNEVSTSLEGKEDKVEMENSQTAPVITLLEMDKEQIKELCEQIELLRKEYLILSERLYKEQDVVDGLLLDHLKTFMEIYNVIAKICGKGKGLPVPELELRPSLAWIRHILYPDDYPHPDNLPDDGPSSSL